MFGRSPSIEKYIELFWVLAWSNEPSNPSYLISNANEYSSFYLEESVRFPNLSVVNIVVDNSTSIILRLSPIQMQIIVASNSSQAPWGCGLHLCKNICKLSSCFLHFQVARNTSKSVVRIVPLAFFKGNFKSVFSHIKILTLKKIYIYSISIFMRMLSFHQWLDITSDFLGHFPQYLIILLTWPIKLNYMHFSSLDPQHPSCKN